MKKCNFTIITFAFALMALCSPRMLLAQGANDHILIWPSNSFPVAKGVTQYEFTASAAYLSITIENLTLKTDYGDIVFSNPLSRPESKFYSMGYLSSSEEEMEQIVIRSASGTINGEKKDVLPLIKAERHILPMFSTNIMQLYIERNTIDISELYRFVLPLNIDFGRKYRDTPILSTKELLKSAMYLYSNFNTASRLYNNDTFYELAYEAGIYILVVTNDPLQGFKVVKLEAGQEKDKGEVLFEFTCEVGPPDIHGSNCIKPQIKENGKKIPIDTAMKSNKIILTAISLYGTLTWNQVD